MRYYLGIDQGTSSTTVAAFDERLTVCAMAQRPITTYFPTPHRAEQSAREIVASVRGALAAVLQQIGGARRVGAVGIANQGESVVAWHADGSWISPVILWSDERGLDTIEAIRAGAMARVVETRSGLPLSPYFSASKMHWLLAHDPHVKEAQRGGSLRIGTLDTLLAWELGGQRYLSDQSTASRTQLLDLEAAQWDDQLLALFSIEPQLLAPLMPSLGDLGYLHADNAREKLAWRASMVDQPAALAGNGCFAVGDVKITYGTGGFVVVNAGTHLPRQADGLARSLAWTSANQRTYATDGGVFAAGSALQWLVDIGVLHDAAEASQLAQDAGDTHAVRFVPALQGLGAPWWQPQQQALLDGISSATTRAHIVRAVLDGIAFRICDIVRALRDAGIINGRRVRVDGGLANCDYLMQRQADLLGVPLDRGVLDEATVFGAAALAALASEELDEGAVIAANPVCRSYEPRISADQRELEYSEWLGWLQSRLR